MAKFFYPKISNANRWLPIIVLFLIPSIVGTWAIISRNASGPFWLGCNLDPDYAYMMNSLSITQHHPVWHADHPGATLQILGAVLLYPFNLIMGKEEFVRDVLSHPEYYMAYLHIALTCLLSVSLIIAGLLTLKWTNDFIAAMLVQFGIILSHTSRDRLRAMSPEILLLILSVIFVIIILYHDRLIRNGKDKGPAWQYGLIAGMGMALKINFAPLLIMPLILLKGTYRRLIYCGTTIAVFLILMLNPVMQFERFRNFLFDLASRKGYNAPIKSGSGNLQAMSDGFGRLADQCVRNEILLILLFVVFIAVGVLILSFRFFKNLEIKGKFYLRCWLGFIVVLFFQFILVANGPRANIHYLTPILGMMGLMLFISRRWLILEFGELKGKLFKYIVMFNSAIIACVVLLTLFYSSDQLKNIAKSSDRWQEVNRFKAENDLSETPTVYYYRSSNKMYALAFGNSFARRNFGKQLSELYPGYYEYGIWSPGFRIFDDFTYDPINASNLMNQSEIVLFQGSKRPTLITDFKTAVGFPISSETIFEGSVECIVLFKRKNNVDKEDNK